MAKKAADAGAALILMSDNLDALKAALAKVGKASRSCTQRPRRILDAISALAKELIARLP